MEKGVSFRVLDDWGKESIIWIRCADRMEDVRVEFDKGHRGQGCFCSLFWLDIWVAGKSISGGVGDPWDVSNLGIKSR